MQVHGRKASWQLAVVESSEKATTSFPGLGALTGARILGDLGDDHTRFTRPRALEGYAGSALVPRSSGRKTTDLARRIKNQRLASLGYIWAFAALIAPSGARAHYDRRHAAEGRHVTAQRNLSNRLLGCLHHCLTHRFPYDEQTALPSTAKLINRIGCLSPPWRPRPPAHGRHRCPAAISQAPPPQRAAHAPVSRPSTHPACERDAMAESSRTW